MSDNAETVPAAEPDGRATRWNDHKAQRRERILQAAIDAINESGSDVGVQQIAERANLPRSVVYRVFTGRSDLDEQIRARIIDMLMADLAPVLTPEGSIDDSITRAVDTYMRWIVEVPRLHQFLGTGSATRRTTGSRVVTGTKTAIAVQLTGLFETLLRGLDKGTQLAESLAFGVIGLVDVSVNRWLSNSQSALSIEELADFLTVSIWQVIDGNLRTIGAVLDPATPISELL